MSPELINIQNKIQESKSNSNSELIKNIELNDV